jgi:hypothetical protein
MLIIQDFNELIHVFHIYRYVEGFRGLDRNMRGIEAPNPGKQGKGRAAAEKKRRRRGDRGKDKADLLLFYGHSGAGGPDAHGYTPARFFHIDRRSGFLKQASNLPVAGDNLLTGITVYQMAFDLLFPWRRHFVVAVSG